MRKKDEYLARKSARGEAFAREARGPIYPLQARTGRVKEGRFAFEGSLP